MRQSPLRRWQGKVIGSLVLVAFAPVVLLATVLAFSIVLGAVAGVLWSLVPYAGAVLVLGGLYRLVLGRRR